MKQQTTDISKRQSSLSEIGEANPPLARLKNFAEIRVPLDTDRRDSWTAITADLFSPKSPIDAEALVHLICSEGGRVAILTRHNFTPGKSYLGGESEAEYILALKQAERLFEELPDSVRLLPISKSTYRMEYWSRDLGGILVEGERGDTVQILFKEPEISEEYRDLVALEVHRQRRFALGSSVERIQLGLKAVQGEFAFIGSDTVLITEATRKRNKHLSFDQIVMELARIGRPRVLVVPELASGCFHADYVAVQVGEAIFVPKLDTLAKHHWSEPDLTPFINALQNSCEILKQAGINPVGLPMPVPPIPDAAPCLLSPVNLSQFRTDSGKLVVIVPWPANNPVLGRPRFSSSFTAKWIDPDLHHDYQAKIRQRLQEAGADVIHFLPIRMQPDTSGLAHCLTKEIPGSLVELAVFSHGVRKDELSSPFT